MSYQVFVAPARGRRVLAVDADGVSTWLSMLSEAHGLDVEAEGGGWLLTGDDLVLQVALTGRGSRVRAVEVSPHLHFEDEEQERAVKALWREVLGQMMAFAGQVDGVLRSSDADRMLAEEDLDDESGITRITSREEQPEPAKDLRWMWSPKLRHTTPAEPMHAVLAATDPQGGLACDASVVRAWLADREDLHRQLVTDMPGGWQVSIGRVATIDLTAVHDAGRLARLELMITPAYRDVAQELASRRLVRIFLDDLVEFGQGIGGVLMVGDPPRVPDDDGLYEFVGMTRMARRRFVLPAGARPRVDFGRLTTAEAQQVMDQWLAEEPARLAWLEQQCRGQVVLDGSPDSLVPLWRWARSRLRWRAHNEGIDLQQLPVWVLSAPGMPHDELNDDTLWLIDAIARYWVRVWQQLTGDEWVLHTTRMRADGLRNRPKLRLFNRDPITPVYVSAIHSLTHSPDASDDGLRELLKRALKRKVKAR